MESARTQDTPPCGSSLALGGTVPGVFTLTLALGPPPERTRTFTSAFRCNGVAGACGLKRPQCLFHMGFYSLKIGKCLQEGHS